MLLTANSNSPDQRCFLQSIMTDQHRSHDIIRNLKGLTRVIGGLDSFVNDTVDDR